MHHLHLIFTLDTMFEAKNLTFNEYIFALHPRGDLLMLYIYYLGSVNSLHEPKCISMVIQPAPVHAAGLHGYSRDQNLFSMLY